MLAMMDYPKTEAHPEFTLALRTNFKSSEPDERFGFRFVGSEGTIVCGPTVTVTKNAKRPEFNYSIDSFPKAMQEQYLAKNPIPKVTVDEVKGQAQDTFSPPAGFDSHTEHHKVFLEAVRTRKPVIEDALFGFRAAGPALLSNTSFAGKKVCHWDPKNLKEVQG
jgi:hypothetical protein